MYSVTQFAKQVGVSVKTLQRWDREGRLKAKRTLSGRRYYDEADLARALNLPMREALRRTIAYCRVSSPAQRPDLANQRAALEQYAQTNGIAVDEWVMEIGGGLNFERKRFLSLVDSIKVARAGGTLFIASRWFPSTKRCSCCGHVKKRMPLKHRTYQCLVCGLVIDRDLNAALNLAWFATEMLRQLRA